MDKPRYAEWPTILVLQLQQILEVMGAAFEQWNIYKSLHLAHVNHHNQHTDTHSTGHLPCQPDNEQCESSEIHVIERYQTGRRADNELTTVSNCPQIPPALGHRNQHYVCCENSLYIAIRNTVITQ